jgi:DNA-binding IclR family transcriptional regulator
MRKAARIYYYIFWISGVFYITTELSSLDLSITQRPPSRKKQRQAEDSAAPKAGLEPAAFARRNLRRRRPGCYETRRFNRTIRVMPARSAPRRTSVQSTELAQGGLPPVNKSTLLILKSLYSFTKERHSFGVSEFAAELGITKNMAFRALGTLLDEGFLVRDPTGKRYELGYRVLMFMHAGDETDIRAICLKYMQILQGISGCTVVFSIPMGPHLITIDGIDFKGQRMLRANWLPVPLHASPGSRAILSFLHDDEIEEYIRISSPLKRVTPTTITDPDKLRAEVRLVRRKGYAIGYEDRVVGANFVSFPVLDESGRPHGAITIGGPKDRFTKERMFTLIPELAAVMAELNREASFLDASPIFMSQQTI